MFDAALSPMVATHHYRNRDLLISINDTMHICGRHLNSLWKMEELIEESWKKLLAQVLIITNVIFE